MNRWLAALLLVAWFAGPRGADAQAAKALDVYTIDVGWPKSASREASTEQILDAVKKAGLTQIDYLVLSHFDVDHIGTPVLVKASYFPNWAVDGAQGPYRVTPNLMVVVPTANHVHLHYENTNVEYAAYLLTLLGIVLVIVLARRPPPLMPEPLPASGDLLSWPPPPYDEEETSYA